MNCKPRFEMILSLLAVICGIVTIIASVYTRDTLNVWVGFSLVLVNLGQIVLWVERTNRVKFFEMILQLAATVCGVFLVIESIPRHNVGCVLLGISFLLISLSQLTLLYRKHKKQCKE